MSSLKRIVTIAALLPVLALATVPKETGTGGDAYTQEFIELGYELVENLSTSPLVGVDHALLYQKIQETKVESQAQLFLNGAEVDAINYAKETPPRIEM